MRALAPVFVVIIIGVIGPIGVFGVLAVAGALAACEAPPQLTRGIDADTHEPYFPIKSGAHALGVATVGGPMSCDSCHGGRDSFEQFKCIECHQFDPQAVPPRRAMQVVHRGIPGWVPENPFCLQCHPRGDIGSAQGVEIHSVRSFPIGEGDTHGSPAFLQRANTRAGGNTCDACHANDLDLSQLLCAECHAEDTNPTIVAAHDDNAGLEASFRNETEACLLCHGTTPAFPLAGHAVFFDYNHHFAERRTQCASCHSARQPEPKEWTTDFSIATCNACHFRQPCTRADQSGCIPLQ